MLTRDSIIKLPSCTGLTDEQIADLTTLSKNDEDQVIHDKTRDWYKNWDKDIFETTGLEKGATEKTYEYHKRAWTETLAALETAKTELSTLKAKAEKGDLSAEDKQKIKDLNDEIKALKTNHEAELKKVNDLLELKAKEIETVYTDAELMTALSSAPWDESVKHGVREAFVKNVFETIKSEFTREVVVEENGSRRVQWRDKEGNIVRNPDNKQHPITTAELVLPRLADVLDTGRKVEGTGKNGVEGKPPSSSKFINNVKSQNEFTQKATDYLLKSGVERGSQDFTKQFDALWKEHKVSDLPFLEK